MDRRAKARAAFFACLIPAVLIFLLAFKAADETTGPVMVWTAWSLATGSLVVLAMLYPRD